MPGLALVEIVDVPRHVLLEPRADLLAEGDVLGGVVEIHGGASLPGLRLALPLG
jgi:hypothetical protein